MTLNYFNRNTMKKIHTLLSILYILLSCSTIAFGQGKKGGDEDRIAEFRRAVIKENLFLTPEQEKNFFPLYDTYSQKRHELRRQEHKLKKGSLAKPDDQIKKDIYTILELRKQELALEEDFVNKALKILSIRQLAELYRTEIQIRNKLLERYKGMDHDID